jgi:uncharacterized protein YprB with RNaseH-like and TPR domain
METSKLTDRVRGMLKAPAPPNPVAAAPSRIPREALERVLEGDWRDHGGRRWFFVERRVPSDARHGTARVGDLARNQRKAVGHAPLLAAGAPARPPLMFFDLETTGLSGGAGTFAFLVGCGWFGDDDSFVTRQYLMTEFDGERAMLEAVGRELAGVGGMVSFNGKSFDAPVLETRYLFHRLAWPAAHLPHLDVLHPARRFWGGDEGVSSSLSTLERQVLGARREEDVPGFEIPARYFQFVRSGDARPLSGVLEHNRLDLLSLASLTVRLLLLVAEGPAAARDAREAMALGRVYARSGLDERARECFECVLTMDAAAGMRVESLRFLACMARRGRRFDQAAAHWREVVETPGCPPHVRREAHEALAIHHEHRVRDLSAAKSFALKSLAGDSRRNWNDAVRHRLARLERKIERAEQPGLLAY